MLTPLCLWIACVKSANKIKTVVKVGSISLPSPGSDPKQYAQARNFALLPINTKKRINTQVQRNVCIRPGEAAHPSIKELSPRKLVVQIKNSPPHPFSHPSFPGGISESRSLARQLNVSWHFATVSLDKRSIVPATALKMQPPGKAAKQFSDTLLGTAWWEKVAWRIKEV